MADPARARLSSIRCAIVIRVFGVILLTPITTAVGQNPIVGSADPTDPRGEIGSAATSPKPVVISEPIVIGDSERIDVLELIDDELWPPAWTVEETEPSDGPSNGRPNASPTTNLTVEIQSDLGWFNQDATNRATVGDIPDGAFFRRARFGIYGELYDTFEYRSEFDFAGDGRPRFLDNWIALTNLPLIRNVILGHYFEPFSLERYTPNRFITFAERSLADTFAPARNMGAMVYGNAFDERMTWATGLFRSNSDDYGDQVTFNNDYALTVHSTFLAWFEEDADESLRLLHLGASGSMRHPGDERVRFSTQPSARVRQQGVGGVPAFVDTGELQDVRNYWLYGLEAAWVHGPFSIQGEMINATVDRTSHEDPSFRSAYVFGSWFLTGESRSYSPTSVLGRFREGIFQRVTPRRNLFDPSAGGGWSGCGAFELAVRWSFIDLNDEGVAGGRLEETTFGLNWYLNRHTKVVMNYIRPTLYDPNMGKSDAEIYLLRWQFEF